MTRSRHPHRRPSVRRRVRSRRRAALALAPIRRLTKPRVVQLIVFCACIGMLLAVPAALAGRRGGVALAATPASGSWPAPRRPSTAWSSSTSTPR
jgi:hypothetical protein